MHRFFIKWTVLYLCCFEPLEMFAQTDNKLLIVAILSARPEHFAQRRGPWISHILAVLPIGYVLTPQLSLPAQHVFGLLGVELRWNRLEPINLLQ